MGRKILLVTTDQQRYDTLGCNGGTLARTPVVDALGGGRDPLRAGHPAVRRVHAVPLHHSHRAVPDHPRGVDERGPAPGRRTVSCRCPPPGRLPDRAHRQGALRALPRSVHALHRERSGPDGDHAAGRAPIVASSTSSSRPTARWASCTTPTGCGPSTPRRSAMFYAALDSALQVNAAGGGDTGAPQVHVNTIPRGVVPHRLGRRPHDRVARLARRRRRLVLLDELPRPAPSVGPARSPRSAASTGATCRSRPATRRPLPSARRSSTASLATGGSGTTAPWSPTTRRPQSGCRPPSRPIRCARSTPATPSSAS